jgi:oligopeptidase B
VARLRATAAPGGRLLFRPELGVGAHVGPAGRYDQLRYEAEILAFILDEAGIPEAGAAGGTTEARAGTGEG